MVKDPAMTYQSKHSSFLHLRNICRLFSALVVLCCSLFTACNSLGDFIDKKFFSLFENEPKEGAEFAASTLEFNVNGEMYLDTLFKDYSRFAYRRRGYQYYCLPFFTGVDPYDYTIAYPEFKGVVDFNNFSFNLRYCSYLYEHPPYPLDSGEHGVYPLNIHIESDGHGPFKAGVEYSSLNCFALYYPAPFIAQELGAHGPKTDFLGVEVTLLSSWFKFGYRKAEVPGIGLSDILDFYFDFVEVVNKIPEGFTTPAVGDTIRVSGGHLTQPLFAPDVEMFHACIVP